MSSLHWLVMQQYMYRSKRRSATGLLYQTREAQTHLFCASTPSGASVMPLCTTAL